MRTNNERLTLRFPFALHWDSLENSTVNPWVEDPSCERYYVSVGLACSCAPLGKISDILGFPCTLDYIVSFQLAGPQATSPLPAANLSSYRIIMHLIQNRALLCILLATLTHGVPKPQQEPDPGKVHKTLLAGIIVDFELFSSNCRA